MNFGLRVVGRRPDGYHELESLFLPLDLADELELEAAEAGATRVDLELVQADGGAVPSGPENLAVRAARAFLEAAGLARAVRLRLVKHIPAAAGLGGGSSDAGAVLRGLAALHPGAVDAAGLARLAVGLGADVPFFLDPRPALVSGIGERREPPPTHWPSLVLVLANPGTALATGDVFRAFAAAAGGGPGPSDLRALLAAVGPAPDDSDVLEALLANDLEAAAVGLCPAILGLRDSLRAAGARAVALSGSGATVFGVFPERGRAEAAAARIAATGAWARVARTLESG